MLYDIGIIGAGPAGLTAAIYARRAGHTVGLFEGATPGGQAVDTQTIENWPGTQNISGADFAFQLYDQVRQLEIPIHPIWVTGLRAEGNTLVVQGERESFKCHTVIVANGLRRRLLKVPGETRLKGHGVSYCAVCDGNFFKGKDVAVVGGGDTALEDALYLAKLCGTVWLLSRGDAFSAKQYLIDRVYETPNLRPVMHCSVEEILGEGTVEGVRLAGSALPQQHLAVAGVFVAVGFQPDNAAFAPPLQLDDAGFLFARDDCTTEVPGVFVAGDCRAKEFRQLVTASADGAIAASKAGQYLQEGPGGR